MEKRCSRVKFDAKRPYYLTKNSFHYLAYSEFLGFLDGRDGMKVVHACDLGYEVLLTLYGLSRELTRNFSL